MLSQINGVLTTNKEQALKIAYDMIGILNKAGFIANIEVNTEEQVQVIFEEK